MHLDRVSWLATSLDVIIPMARQRVMWRFIFIRLSVQVKMCVLQKRIIPPMIWPKSLAVVTMLHLLPKAKQLWCLLKPVMSVLRRCMVVVMLLLCRLLMFRWRAPMRSIMYLVVAMVLVKTIQEQMSPEIQTPCCMVVQSMKPMVVVTRKVPLEELLPSMLPVLVVFVIWTWKRLLAQVRMQISLVTWSWSWVVNLQERFLWFTEVLIMPMLKEMLSWRLLVVTLDRCLVVITWVELSMVISSWILRRRHVHLLILMNSIWVVTRLPIRYMVIRRNWTQTTSRYRLMENMSWYQDHR